MPRPRFRNLRPEKQRVMLDAAADEFSRFGYAGASVNHIISRAGLSKGALYYYFDDKADLFIAVMEEAVQEILAVVRAFPEVHEVESYWRGIADITRDWFAFSQRHPRVRNLVRAFAAALARGELDPSIEAWHEGSHLDWNERLLDLGRRIGAVRTDLPRDLLLDLLGAIHHVSDMWFSRHDDDLETDRDSWMAISEKLVAITRRVLEPVPPGREEAR